MSHLEEDQKLVDDKPHIWIQWKGIDVCCDIHCTCGYMSHYDGDFFYQFKCPNCGQCYETGSHVVIYPIPESETDEYLKLVQRNIFKD